MRIAGGRGATKLTREQVLELAKLAYERGEKPDLSGRDLSDLGLFHARLPEADLSQSDLRQVVLTRADLNGADLSKPDLTEANLTQASLRGANLSHTKDWELNNFLTCKRNTR